MIQNCIKVSLYFDILILFFHSLSLSLFLALSLSPLKALLPFMYISVSVLSLLYNHVSSQKHYVCAFVSVHLYALYFVCIFLCLRICILFVKSVFVSTSLFVQEINLSNCYHQKRFPFCLIRECYSGDILNISLYNAKIFTKYSWCPNEWCMERRLFNKNIDIIVHRNKEYMYWTWV